LASRFVLTAENSPWIFSEIDRVELMPVRRRMEGVCLKFLQFRRKTTTDGIGGV
jgi:hypothetical protein